MFFKKKNTEPEKKEEKRDNSEMSQIIDEVLNEQAAQKEAAQQEAVQNTELVTPKQKSEQSVSEQNKHITELIEKFTENPGNETFKEVFDALLLSTLLVPMVLAAEQDNTKNKKYHPGIVENKDKEKFFPAFTERSQIPDDFAEKFTLLAMKFADYSSLITQLPDCEKLLINPFTKQFVVNANIAGAVAKNAQKQNVQNQIKLEFSTPEPETQETVDIITEHFRTIPEIEKAYFSKMKAQDKTSYVFIVDCPKEQHQDIFKGLIEFFKEQKIKFDVSIMFYEPLKQLVEESKHINLVYSK